MPTFVNVAVKTLIKGVSSPNSVFIERFELKIRHFSHYITTIHKHKLLFYSPTGNSAPYIFAHTKKAPHFRVMLSSMS